MNKKTLSKLSFIMIALICLVLVACGENSTNSTNENSEPKTIKMAISTDIEPMASYAIEPLKKMGYNLELTIFDDYVMPNQALQEGSVHCNLFQHELYMNTYNDSNGTNIVMLEPKIFDNPYGIYSNKIKSLEDVTDGSSIAIAVSPSNRDRALKGLEAAGLLTLVESPIDEYYSVADIATNPNNLKLLTVEQLTLYAMLDDVDMIVQSCGTIYDQGGDASADLFRFTEEDYNHGIAVNAGDENTDWAKALIEVFHTEEFSQALKSAYPGVYEVVGLE